MSKKIETDLKTFIKFWLVPVGIMLVILFVYTAATGLIVVGASIFLTLALKPLVHKVNNFFTKCFGSDKKHQTLSAVMAYLIVVLIIGGIVAIVGPVVVNETARFVQNFPETFEKTFGGWDGVNDFGRSIGVEDLHEGITHTMSDISGKMVGFLQNNLVSSVSGVADIVMKIVLVLVLTLLFLLEGPELLDQFWRLVGIGKENDKSARVARDVVAKMTNVISTYVSRQVLVAMIDGLASGLIVFLLSIFLGISTSLAIPMGMITMLFYLIPMFGQFMVGHWLRCCCFFRAHWRQGYLR